MTNTNNEIKNEVKKENKNYERIKFEKKNRTLVYLSIIMLIIGIALLKNGLTNDSETISTPYYSYKATKSSDYNVSLKPNTFYDETVLPSGQQYAAPVVDKYNFTLNYNYDGSEKTNMDYTYNITAELVGNVKNGNNNEAVWTKQFILASDKRNQKVNESSFSITEGIVIDYTYYNSLARLYEQTYGLSLDAYLNVKLNLTGNITLPNNKETNKLSDTIEITIPLNNTVTEVQTNYEPTTSKEFLDIVEENNDDNSKLACSVIGITLCILAIIVFSFTLTRRKVTSEAQYRKNLNKVLREYGDLIVTVTNKPDLRNLKSMRLAMLEDLVDAAEQNKSNIIHYEKIKDRESLLLVIAHGYVYTYSITADEFNGQN